MDVTKLFKKQCESTGKNLQRGKIKSIIKESREANKEVSIQNRPSTNQYLHSHPNWRYTIINAAEMSSHPNFMRVIQKQQVDFRNAGSIDPKYITDCPKISTQAQ